jgi:hypothetical protein
VAQEAVFLCAVTFFEKFGETKPAAARRRSREDIGLRIAAAGCDGRVSLVLTRRVTNFRSASRHGRSRGSRRVPAPVPG